MDHIPASFAKVHQAIHTKVRSTSIVAINSNTSITELIINNIGLDINSLFNPTMIYDDMTTFHSSFEVNKFLKDNSSSTFGIVQFRIHIDRSIDDLPVSFFQCIDKIDSTGGTRNTSNKNRIMRIDFRRRIVEISSDIEGI